MKTAKTNVIICPFAGILPVSSMEEGLRLGRYTDPCNLTSENVPIRLGSGKKNLYVVGSNQIIEGSKNIEPFLRAWGKQPCRDAPGYLLGLMAQITEKQMPPEFHNKHIVAAEPDNPLSVFIDDDGHPCSLCVFRGGEGRRPGLISIEYRLYPFCLFLAEDISLITAP